MPEFVIVHSTISGKTGAEEGALRIAGAVSAAFGGAIENAGNLVASVSSVEDIKKIVAEIISKRMPKFALNGGDGFVALFFNHFFRAKEKMENDDYNPDVLFMKGGTGNAISYCGHFKNDAEGLRSLNEGTYNTEPVNLLEVISDEKKELAHFVSFGADGEIIDIYSRQKLKGLVGYIWAVLRYSFSRKLYNIFSRNDANYDLKVEKDGEEIHTGRHEGGGISSIPYVGYGFRPYPLAVNGKAHIRFVLFGTILMPTMFKITNWVFTKRPNKIIYDHEISEPCILDFSFDKKLHIQIAGDLREKQQSVRVGYSKKWTINLVKKTVH
jgi:diacylglycerol kinase family enzyme